MAPTLVVMGDTDIIERRKELLARAGMTADQMRALADVYELDQEKQAILNQLEELDFLSSRS